MIALQTDRALYYYCSQCRKRMTTRYYDGDVESLVCPSGEAGHDGLITYKTHEGLKRYAAKLFQGLVGMGAKE